MAENALPELQRLAAAEAAGAPLREPVRWRQAQALAARLEGQPPAVRRVLAARLARVLDAMDTAAAAPTTPATERPGLQALVALNQQLRTPAESAPPVAGVATPPPTNSKASRVFGAPGRGCAPRRRCARPRAAHRPTPAR